MVKVERFTPNPEHGRPMIASFTGPEGKLAVHCGRDDGSLWLYAYGPRGGDRGTVVFPAREWPRLLGWLDTGARGAAPSTTGAIWLDRRGDGEERTLAVASRRTMFSPRWLLALDDTARDELIVCLREWAAAVRAQLG